MSRFDARHAHQQETLVVRRKDVENYFIVPIQQASLPPATPAQPLDPSSPAIHHPYTRPESSESVTLKHWIYDLQKNLWIFNEKTLRYESTVTTLLTQGSRRRKLVDLGVEAHTSWVNLMLHLGLVISQHNSESQQQTAADLNKLVIATGLTDVVLGETAVLTPELGPDNIKSLYLQGEKHLLGYGVPQSFDIAFKRYEAAAKHGLAEAATMLGVMYEFGMGHKKDLGLAVKYYTTAAGQNNADALNHLGRLYEAGKGCEVSYKSAASVYKKAAQLGHTDGMTNLGTLASLTPGYMLQHGRGCAENKQLAVEYYQMAADRGYARAQNALGTCHYLGTGVKRDYFTAAVYYRKAADQGYAPAQNNLGICYEEGNGIPQDTARAKAYYKLASEKKHAGATNNFAYLLLAGHEFLEAIEKFYLAKGLGRWGEMC
ncbi:hypothetical protein HDU91_002624 [Kappamyces sp. JEL0680]|nr:hypothetical protein HDU91_002624 [Kappamyces sp. JEL0680]